MMKELSAPLLGTLQTRSRKDKLCAIMSRESPPSKQVNIAFKSYLKLLAVMEGIVRYIKDLP